MLTPSILAENLSQVLVVGDKLAKFELSEIQFNSVVGFINVNDGRRMFIVFNLPSGMVSINETAYPCTFAENKIEHLINVVITNCDFTAESVTNSLQQTTEKCKIVTKYVLNIGKEFTIYFGLW